MIKSNSVVGGIYEYALQTKTSFSRIMNDRDNDALNLRGAYYLLLRRADYTLDAMSLICGRPSSAIHRSIKSAERRLERGDKGMIQYYEIAKKIAIKKNEINYREYVS